MASLLLIEHFDRPWRRQSSIPLVRVGGEIILLCQSKTEAAAAVPSARQLLRKDHVSYEAKTATVVDLTGEHRAHCLGFGVRLDVGELELTIDERGWRWLSRLIGRRSMSGRPRCSTTSTIAAFTSRFAPAFKFVNTKAAHNRIGYEFAKVGVRVAMAHVTLRRMWHRVYQQWRSQRPLLPVFFSGPGNSPSR